MVLIYVLTRRAVTVGFNSFLDPSNIILLPAPDNYSFYLICYLPPFPRDSPLFLVILPEFFRLLKVITPFLEKQSDPFVLVLWWNFEFGLKRVVDDIIILTFTLRERAVGGIIDRPVMSRVKKKKNCLYWAASIMHGDLSLYWLSSRGTWTSFKTCTL